MQPLGKSLGHASSYQAHLLLGSMLEGHRESRIAQQDSYWTAIGVAAGESPRSAPHQHQRTETLLRHRRCVGALAAATMPIAQDSLTASAAALSLGAGTPAFRHTTRKSRVDREHSVFADGRGWT